MEKIRGIILAVEKRGEADLVVSIFTKDYGKLKTVAQGVRKGASKLRAILQPGHMIEAVLIPLRSGQYRLTSPFLHQSFASLKSDPAKTEVLFLSLAALNSIILEGSKEEHIWDFALRFFSDFETLPLGRSNVRDVHLWFLANLFPMLGFMSFNHISPELKTFLEESEHRIKQAYIERAYASLLGYLIPSLSSDGYGVI